MYRVVKSPLAESDFKGIWLYSYNKWGENQAVDYLLQLDAGIQGLVSNPNMGQSRENIRTGYRSIQISHHVIYYRIDDDVIDIIRVLHESMLPTKHL